MPSSAAREGWSLMLLSVAGAGLLIILSLLRKCAAWRYFLPKPLWTPGQPAGLTDDSRSSSTRNDPPPECVIRLLMNLGIRFFPTARLKQGTGPRTSK